MDIAALKKQLAAEKVELEKDLGLIARVNPQKAGDWEVTPEMPVSDTAFRDEVADQLEDMDEREEIEINLEQRFHNVKLALQKIEVGEYGQCEVCGQPIEEARLMANPAARTCKTHLDQERGLSQS